MGDVTVLSPGLLTTVQDSGRRGYQQYGVTVSGVMDAYAHRTANWLVGNKDNEAVLEITLLGPTLLFNREMVVAVTGGDLGARLNGFPMEPWASVAVQEGDKLSFSGIKWGCRGIIAFGGGVQVPLLMDSRSTYTRGSLGGHEGRPLIQGDELTIGKTASPLQQVLGRKGVPKTMDTNNPVVIRVVNGPQDDAFTQEGMDTFYRETYQVTKDSDRMGCRLSGPPIAHKKAADIVSDGIAMGAIQVPGDGCPIVMMADRQTTGGYTKIANVISVDLPLMAQVKPGDRIRFQWVTVEEAQNLLLEEEAFFSQLNQLKKAGTLPASKGGKAYRIRVGGKSYHVLVEERSD